jgi:hypothetical protein
LIEASLIRASLVGTTSVGASGVGTSPINFSENASQTFIGGSFTRDHVRTSGGALIEVSVRDGIRTVDKALIEVATIRIPWIGVSQETAIQAQIRDSPVRDVIKASGGTSNGSARRSVSGTSAGACTRGTVSSIPV